MYYSPIERSAVTTEYRDARHPLIERSAWPTIGRESGALTDLVERLTNQLLRQERLFEEERARTATLELELARLKRRDRVSEEQCSLRSLPDRSRT